MFFNLPLKSLIYLIIKIYQVFFEDNIVIYLISLCGITKKIKELIDFSYGSPGRCIVNLQFWLSLSTSLRQKLEIQLNNPIELLKLAKEITDELNIEQQLWLIDFQQNRAWIKEKNSNIVIQLEELRKQLLKFVQPRLAWEVTLLEINFLN